jgi:hypothetical protein
MEDGNPCGLTIAEEAHRLQVHQRHRLQVQHCPGAVTLSVCLQCLQIHRVPVADQPERRAVPIGVPCNLACYWRCLLPGLYAVCER